MRNQVKVMKKAETEKTKFLDGTRVIVSNFSDYAHVGLRSLPHPLLFAVHINYHHINAGQLLKQINYFLLENLFQIFNNKPLK